MTATRYSVKGAEGISRGARNAVLAIAVLLMIYGAGIGWTASRARTVASEVGEQQMAVQASRLEACEATNENNAKLREAIHDVFIGENPNPSRGTLEGVAKFDEALAARDCREVVRLAGR